MSTFKAVLLKGNIHLKDDGTSNIKIRITHNRKADYISTDLFIIPTEFDENVGVAKFGRNREYINYRITDKLKEYRQLDIQLGDRKESMTVKEIKGIMISGTTETKMIDFFEFAEEYLKDMSSVSHKRNMASFISILKTFSGEKLKFAEINVQFLLRFESYLRRKGVKNGINNYMRMFRALFNKARDSYNDENSGVIAIPHYPFKKYQIPKPKLKTREHCISVEELKMFINYKPENEGEKLAKDMFLLMIYLIGIETKDLFYLDKPNRKGRVYYDRFKTGKEYSIRIEREANEIIERYKGKKLLLDMSERFQLHESFIRTVNNYLHGEKHHNITGIFLKIGIRKKVTTKWARHTWATIARNDCRINKDDVALCLGHEDIDNKVTDMYVKYDYTIIDESNRKVIDMIFENKPKERA
jgi:site-specific recombinase XerD